MKNIKEIEARYREQPPEVPRKLDKVFKKRYLLIIIFIIALFTNPGQEKHKRAIMDGLSKAGYYAYSENPESQSAYDQQITRLIDQHVSSSGYLLFSTTNVEWSGRTYIAGIGIFGKVFLFKDPHEFVGRISH